MEPRQLLHRLFRSEATKILFYTATFLTLLLTFLAAALTFATGDYNIPEELALVVLFLLLRTALFLSFILVPGGAVYIVWLSYKKLKKKQLKKETGETPSGN